MKFSEVLSALASPFKTLPQATAALEPAKATLDSVSALFTAAGLNLETMLAAGPDSLKAHLASLDHSADLAALNQKFTALENQAKELQTTAAAQLKEVEALAGTVKHFATAIGVPLSADTKREDYVKLFEAHVAKATTLALAKTGHPPAHVPAATETTTAIATDADLAAEYTKLEGQARLDFYTKHEASLNRFAKARK